MQTLSDQKQPSNKKPINVLFINDHLGFAEGVIHGPARYYLNILKCFDPSVINANLCILREWHPFADEMAKADIKPIFLSRSKWDPCVIIDLIKIVKQNNIEILHLAGMKGCLLGRIVSRISGIISVVHFRDMNPEGFVISMLQRSISSWTDYALAVSEPIRDFAVREYAVPKERIEVLHNPVSDKFLSPSDADRSRIRDEFNIPQDKKVAALVGRVSPEKGHALLIRAFPYLLEKCPEAMLMIVGDGPAMNESKQLVKQLKLERTVIFTGYRDDIPSVLAAVDAVVMPSAREGFPNAALEAIASGRPVVAFSVGGLPDIVMDGKTGYLSAPGDIDALAESLAKILIENELREKMGQECRRHAGNFTIMAHLKRLEAIYVNLLVNRVS